MRERKLCHRTIDKRLALCLILCCIFVVDASKYLKSLCSDTGLLMVTPSYIIPQNDLQHFLSFSALVVGCISYIWYGIWVYMIHHFIERLMQISQNEQIVQHIMLLYAISLHPYHPPSQT